MTIEDQPEPPATNETVARSRHPDPMESFSDRRSVTIADSERSQPGWRTGMRGVGAAFVLSLGLLAVLWLVSAGAPSSGGATPDLEVATRPPRSTGVFAPPLRPTPTPHGVLTPERP